MTCSITELGFVRVLAQAPQYGFTVAHARALLLRLKRGKILSFEVHPRRSRRLPHSRLGQLREDKLAMVISWSWRRRKLRSLQHWMGEYREHT